MSLRPPAAETRGMPSTSTPHDRPGSRSPQHAGRDTTLRAHIESDLLYHHSARLRLRLAAGPPPHWLMTPNCSTRPMSTTSARRGARSATTLESTGQPARRLLASAVPIDAVRVVWDAMRCTPPASPAQGTEVALTPGGSSTCASYDDPTTPKRDEVLTRCALDLRPDHPAVGAASPQARDRFGNVKADVLEPPCRLPPQLLQTSRLTLRP